MELKHSQLDEAVSRGLISAAQADGLWAFLSAHAQERPALRLTHVLYYLGGLIAIGAMTLFMNLGWEQFGGGGLLLTSGGLNITSGGLRVSGVAAVGCDVKSDASGNFFCGADAGAAGGEYRSRVFEVTIQSARALTAALVLA